MSAKPQPTRQLVIVETFPTDRVIRFDATPEVADRIRADELGSVIVDDAAAPSYTLKVSAIYDFESVADYLRGMAA